MNILNKKIGYIYSFGYVFVTAFSMTFIQSLPEQYSPLLSLFITALFTTLFFHVVNYKKIADIYKISFKYKYSTALLCLNSLIMWVLTFYGNRELGSFGYIFLTFIIASIISFFILQRNRTSFFSFYTFSIFGLIGILLLGVIQLKKSTIIPSYLPVWLGITGGIVSYLNRKQIHIFSRKTKLPATAILAVRFYGILLILGLGTTHNWGVVNLYLFWTLLLLAIVTFIIPLYFNQRAIMDLGAEKHSIICALCPSVTYIIQSIYIKTWQPDLLLISLITAALLVLPVLHHLPYRKKL
jgi:hypothetical protein